MNSPAFINELSRLSALANSAALDIQGRIQYNAVRSMDILENALDPDSVMHQKLSANKLIDTAQDMLDRAGHSAVKRIESKSVSRQLTAEDIATLKERRARRQRAPVLSAPVLESETVSELIEADLSPEDL